MNTLITRKRFLLEAGAATSATVLSPFVARAARTTVIKLGNDRPVDDPITHGAILAAEQIKKETNGEVEVQVFPNSQLGDDTHMISDVRSGAIQMLQTGDNLIAVLVPSAAIDNVGYAFKDVATAYAALDGTVGDIVRADIVKVGLQPMPAIYDLGLRVVTTSTKPIDVPKDIKNFKIRVPPSPSSLSLFKDLEAAPATINFDEVYTALQTHVVDGQAIDIPSLETAKLYQVQKYCSLTNHMWIGFWTVMNGEFWKRLPADQKKVIATAFDAQALKERIAMSAFTKAMEDKLTSQGLKFNTPDPAPFKALLVKNGFYSFWKRKLGSELWSALERYTGSLA